MRRRLHLVDVEGSMNVQGLAWLGLVAVSAIACGDDGGSTGAGGAPSSTGTDAATTAAATSAATGGQGGATSSGGEGGDPSPGGAGPGGGTSTGEGGAGEAGAAGVGGGGGSGAGGGAPDFWLHHFLGAEDEFPGGVAAYPGGGAVVVGTFVWNLGNTGDEDLEAPLDDAFVARFDDDGTLRWAVRLGAWRAFAQEVEVAPDGGIFVLYQSRGAYAFGSSFVDGEEDFADPVVAKLDGDGVALWATRLGGPGNEETASGLGFGPDGEAAMVATFSGTTSVAGTDLTAEGTASYVATLDPTSGDVAWVKPLDGLDGEVFARDVSSRGGEVVVVGDFTGTMAIDGLAPQVSAGRTDVFLASFDALDGTPTAASRHGSVDTERVVEAVAWGDGLVVAGYFEPLGSIDFGGGEIVAEELSDLFLVALGPQQGEVAWQRRIEAGLLSSIRDVDVDAGGRIALAGNYDGTVDLGGGPLEPGGGGFFARFDAAGEHVESWKLDGAEAAGVAMGPRLIGLGHFRKQAGALGVEVDSSGVLDLLVVGYPPAP